jgi:hypothetical protein
MSDRGNRKYLFSRIVSGLPTERDDILDGIEICL